MDNILTIEQFGALKRMGVVALNEMQRVAVQECRKGGMVLLSPTGSGKTLAYLLPMLERLSCECKSVQAVIVVPSRELAKQVSEVWRSMAVSHRMVAFYGGRPLEAEKAMLDGAAVSVIVATPGRLIDHLKHGTFAVDKCSLLVIDEFDKCLEMGFREDMKTLIELLPSVKTRFLLSATDADEIPAFAGVDGIVRLDFRDSVQPAVRTIFYNVTTTPEKRLDALARLLCSIGNEPVIVFCNFRESVEEVRAFLAQKTIPCVSYHGAMEQKDRELALFRFSSSCSNILISTDLAARGLDIKDVKHVVHYQRPMTNEVFTHRNGRTARWDAEGAVYMMTFEGKELPDFYPSRMEEFNFSERRMEIPAPLWTVLYVGKGKRSKISRGDIAGFFMKKGGLRADEIGTIMVFDDYSYVAVKMNKMRNLLKMVAGEKIKGVKTIIEPVRR